MRRCIAMILVLCGISIGMPQGVYADGECTPNKELKDSFNQAVAAEKSGKLVEAFEAYGNARISSGCDGPNPSWKDAEEGWKRTGQRLGKEAEKKGNLYTESGIYNHVLDSGGFRRVIRKDAGAFEWYTEIGESAEGDRVMVKVAQSKPKDKETFQIVLGHFQGVYGGVNGAETLRDTEEQVKSNPGDKQLQRRIGHLKELQKIASKNIDEALSREEKAYNRKEMVIGQETTAVVESMQHLSLARDWYELFSDPKMNKAAERAERRGDAFMKGEDPHSLSYAKEYYRLADHSEKIRRVKDQANKMGDAHAKKGDYVTALAYYDVAENDAKREEIEPHLEKQAEKQAQETRKQMKEMMKDEKQKEEFKKEQEDLERELGF